MEGQTGRNLRRCRRRLLVVVFVVVVVIVVVFEVTVYSVSHFAMSGDGSLAGRAKRDQWPNLIQIDTNQVF